MDPAPKELVEKLKSSNNILVTVSANPSVDQLAACIGLTLLLNKLKKHATAVFSGNVPSTIEFLKPQETLEKNTDSLRDFIISLDKSKADKLRYKVEENVVKIFITPYKTSINQNDLDFSQGDFNVDVVLCLGISQQQDLDQAITAHGRILHDAVVASINTHEGSELGTINWINAGASSLSEMATELAKELGDDLIDTQIATALLTGIVAETARFSNEKTSPTTMKYSAELMSAGANQQLVANQLQTSSAPLADEPAGAPAAATRSSDGTLEIGHPDAAKTPELPEPEPAKEPTMPEPKAPEPAKPEASEPKIGKAVSNQTTSTSEPDYQPASRMMLQPPSMGGQLTANSTPEGFDPSIDPLTMLGSDKPMLNHLQEGTSVAPPPQSDLPKLDLDTPTVIPSDLAGSQSQTVVSPEPAPLVLPEVPAPAPEEPESPKPEPSFEPLPSEPPDTTPEPTKPAADQIQIDAQGNLVLPGSPPPDSSPPDKQVLADIEQSVQSPHIQDVKGTDAAIATPDAEAARNELAALYSNSPPSTPEPKADLGSSGYLKVQDLPGMEGVEDGERPSGSPPPPLNTNGGDEPAPNAFSPADTPMNMPLPPSMTLPPADTTPPTSSKNDPSAPPPVPPPFNPLP